MGSAGVAKVKSEYRWESLSGRFTAEKECLASYLALAAAETFEGVKPANLINLTLRRQRCGKSLYRLWADHGAALMAEAGFSARVMADRGDSTLLLIYSPEALKAILGLSKVKTLLQRVGYPQEGSVETMLDQLQSRLRPDAFPHEIGVFLGYPLKDVAAFMGVEPLPFTCQGPWKIYGDPTESLKIAGIHRLGRERMARKLSCCRSPLECLIPRKRLRLVALQGSQPFGHDAGKGTVGQYTRKLRPLPIF